MLINDVCIDDNYDIHDTEKYNEESILDECKHTLNGFLICIF